MEDYEGLSLVGTSCAPRDGLRPLKIKTGHVTLLPSHIGHGGQYDTKYSLLA